MALHICRADKMAEWKAGVDSVERTVDLRHNRDASRKWWNGYWERSYISAPVSADTVVARMARNYTLFRYMLGCNAFGKEPTKFNGGLFTLIRHMSMDLRHSHLTIANGAVPR